MKNSKDILKEPAFVLCLERHKDVRYFPTKERLNKAGFENVYPFKGIDGHKILEAQKLGEMYEDKEGDDFDKGLYCASEYLFDNKIKEHNYIGPGQFSVFVGFLSLWRLIACSNSEGAFIFEDDALPRPDFLEIFPKYWDILDGDEDIVFIGSGGGHTEGNFIKNNMFFDGDVDCLHAYYITSKGAQKLLNIYSDVVDYDHEDPLLLDHLSDNMHWTNISNDHLKDAIVSSENEEEYLNLNTTMVNEKFNGDTDYTKYFDKENNLFYNHKPRLCPSLYIADSFLGWVMMDSEKPNRARPWLTLKEYHTKLCSNFKTIAFNGKALEVKGDYMEDEIPWGLSFGLNSHRDDGIIHQNAYQQSSIHEFDLVDELSRIKKSNPTKASHIFLIGLDRCGSNSLLEFIGTSIPVKYDDKGRMGSRMAFNFFNAHKILEGLEDEIPQLCAYGNMQAIFLSGEEKLGGNNQRHIPIFIYRLFKELYTQYPDAKFIFNTRHLEHWIEGRRRIGDGYMMDYFQRCSKPELCGTPEWTEKTIEEVQKDWKKTFENHTQEVRDFFADKQDHRFLEFNISTDHPQKIVDFLPELDLNIQNAWEIIENWGPHNQ